MLVEFVVLPEVLEYLCQLERGRLECCSAAFWIVDIAWGELLAAKIQAIPGIDALLEPTEPLD